MWKKERYTAKTSKPDDKSFICPSTNFSPMNPVVFVPHYEELSFPLYYIMSFQVAIATYEGMEQKTIFYSFQPIVDSWMYDN